MKVLSIDRELKNYLERMMVRAVVHSIFKRALNLETSEGFMISFLSGKNFNGPNTILFSDNTVFTETCIDINMPVILSDKSIDFKNLFTISIDGILIWHHVFPSEFIENDLIEKNFLSFLSVILNEEMNKKISLSLMINKILNPFISSLELEAISANFLSLLSGIKNMDKRRIDYFISRIIGLGTGLTPVGDDMITGFLSAVFYLNKFKYDSREELILDAINIHKKKTNFISSNILHYAVNGRFSQPLLELLAILCTKSVRENISFIKNFLNYGATSGPAISLGILLGYYHFIERSQLWLKI